MEDLLRSLNASQKAAVTCTSKTLAILAGPGSGKTHTLTARTAWLLEHENLQPWNMIVATFTVKAAREMKERIGKLIGNDTAGNLILGTFHSIARRYLIRYGHLINIPKDFTIADSADSLAIIKRVVKRHRLTIDPKVARTRISGRKSKGNLEQNPENRPASKSLEVREFETCYAEYQSMLQRANSLDYDDLLVRCVELLRLHPKCASNIEAVLIDEFQDTNYVQFDLMRLFAAARKRVTIVGDPDQSIYGFRSAETKNFKRMMSQYPETVTIPLEENYRSSGAILLGAIEVIEQDVARIKKSLLPTHAVGTRPVLRRLCSASREAEWIVTEIKRLLALTGDLMNFDDVAILLRTAALSRLIEGALGRSGIPYRMIGGFKFYDRIEIKIVLDYLRVISNPESNDALARIINVPSRRIGEATIKSLLEEAEQNGKSLWTVILDAAQGTRAPKMKLTELANKGLSVSVNIILTGRNKFFQGGSTISDIIDHVLKKTGFEDFLRRSYPEEHEQRWANITEFINQANDFFDLMMSGYDDEKLPAIDGLEQADDPDVLSKFLANVALASDIKDETDAVSKPQVTISTIHAAKGLEWPVVFIPAVYNGHIPHSRAEDTDEERRLLYVAMTRPKALLYLSYPLKNTHHDEATLCQFLTPKSLTHYIEDRGPSVTASVTQCIAQVLRRPLPSQSVIAESRRSIKFIEDDIWPADGIEDNKTRGTEWKGSHGYTEGQQPIKRRRLDSEFLGGSAQGEMEGTFVGYQTTMDQAASFTVASTAIGDGFMSAGSHLKALSELPANSIAPKRARQEKPIDGTISKEQAMPKASRQTSTTRISKRPAGQGSIASFFSKKPSTSTSNPRATSPGERIGLPRPPDNRINQTARPSKQPQRPHLPSPPTRQLVGIQPSLANHRIHTAPSARPRPPKPDDDGIKMRKAYVFLSSSPCKPVEEQEQEQGQEIEALPEDDAPTTLPAIRPTTTMHTTTTMALMTAAGNLPIAAKKTLGVRRSMNGWSSRAGQHSFVPPTMHRRQKPKA